MDHGRGPNINTVNLTSKEWASLSFLRDRVQRLETDNAALRAAMQQSDRERAHWRARCETLNRLVLLRLR